MQVTRPRVTDSRHRLESPEGRPCSAEPQPSLLPPPPPPVGRVPSRVCVTMVLLLSVIGLRLRGWIWVLLLCCCFSVPWTIAQATVPQVYTDQFALHVEGGAEVAKELARKHGFEYLDQILQDHYHLRHSRIAKRSLEPSREHHIVLSNEPQVKWFSQQVLKKRVKRDFFREVETVDDYRMTKLNDPRWPQMWYLNRGNGLDMNVQAAWKKGVTGKGIVVTILDDGLEKNHPDIVENYDKDASYDVNNHDPDPQPRYDIIDSNRHGTRCAGEVAATANNSICSVGIAFGASVGGVRMLDGDVTDAVEAQSLSLNPDHIDIYSVSWGPDDDGKTVDGPGLMATTAFKEGIAKGRRGLGSIFIWASGNGGREQDNCNCDGYTNSMWTLSISSATENGMVPWYSEACSSTLATTYSSGSTGERQIVTTDLHHGCTSTHTGTSASAPLAAGICALALEANKNLTWRDMQHIVVRTARPANLHAKDWKTNGVGRNVSHSFGYGLMDAGAMVDLAVKWRTVPVQKLCEIRSSQADKLIPAKSHVELSLYVRCDNVRFLEHVQAKVTLSATRRGDIHIYLTSPKGTRSTLLAQRPIDGSRAGFQSWPFMTVHSWGENPDGLWKLEVHNEGRFYGRATLKEWSLHLYGTTEDPDRPAFTTVYSTTAATTTTTAATTTTTTTTTSTATNPPPTQSIHSSTASTSIRAHPWPKPTSQYYPRTTAKHQEYFPEDAPPRIESVNELVQENSIAQKDGTDCPEGTFYLHGRCVHQCPSGYYGSWGYSYNYERSQGPKWPNSACLPCHYSCLRCSGANDYQCTACHGDSVLVDGYCDPKSLVEELRTYEHWNNVVIGVFSVLCVVIVCITVYVIVVFWPPVCCCGKPYREYLSVPLGPSSNHNNHSHLSSTSSSPPAPPPATDLAAKQIRPYYDSDYDL